VCDMGVCALSFSSQCRSTIELSEEEQLSWALAESEKMASLEDDHQILGDAMQEYPMLVSQRPQGWLGLTTQVTEAAPAPNSPQMDA